MPANLFSVPQLALLILVFPVAFQRGLEPLNATCIQVIIDDNVRACSAFGVPLANAEAMIKGDVLALQRNFYDGTIFSQNSEGGTLTETVLLRIIFDQEQGKYLMLARKSSDWFELDQIEINNGRTANSSDYFSLVGGSSPRRLKNPVAEHEGKNFNHDPRTLGMFSHLGNLEQAKEVFSGFLSGDSFSGTQNFPDSFEICVRVGSGPDDHGVVELWSYRFGNTHGLPIRFRDYSAFENSPNEPVGIGTSVEFEWKEMAQLHVLIRMESNGFKKYLTHDHRPTDAMATCKWTLHWFSLNEDLPPNIFDENRLKNKRAFDEMIDPVALNADSIIAVLEEERQKLDNGRLRKPDSSSRK
jgi:hypothetical protein